MALGLGTGLFLLTFLSRMTLSPYLLHGWDEWILTGISQEVAQTFLPGFEWHNLVSPTGYSYPPLFFWANGSVLAVIGPGMVAYRIVSALTEAFAVGLLPALALALGQRPGSAACAGALACASLMLAYHNTVTVDYMLACAVLSSLLCLLHATARGSVQWLAMALLLGGFACFVKYHGVVYHAILVMLALLWPSTRHVLFKQSSLKAVGIRLGKCAAAALFFPVLLLLIEAYTWHVFGWERTHIAEVFRVMTWDSFVVHPATGEIVRPSWTYYLVYTGYQLGPLVTAVIALGMLATLRARNGAYAAILAVVVLWFFWASTASLKNARYVLPAVMLAMLFAGALMDWAATRPRLRVAAAILSLLALVQGAAYSIDRAQTYIARAGEARAAIDAVNEHLGPGDTLLAEAEWYQYARAYGGLMEVRVRSPISRKWAEDSDALLTHARAFEMRRKGMLYVQQAYLEQRQSLIEQWHCVFETGAGPHRQALYIRSPERAE